MTVLQPDPPLPLLRATRASMLEHHIRCGIYSDMSTGLPVPTRKVVILKFGQVIAEADDPDWLDSHGDPMHRVDIRGFICDPNQQAVEEEWTEEDIGFVVRDIERRLADPHFTHFVLYETPVPVAPWPSYDEMHHSKIAPFAEQAGMLIQAYDYELMTKKRPMVLTDLKAKIDLQQTEQALTATP